MFKVHSDAGGVFIIKSEKKAKKCGEAADSFFASFLGSKKEVGNGGKAPNTPT